MPKIAAVETPPPVVTEDKRQRFIRVAGSRVKKILKAIDVLNTMARNAASYEFDQTDVDKICDRLAAEVQGLRERMVPHGKRRDIDFEF